MQVLMTWQIAHLVLQGVLTSGPRKKIVDELSVAFGTFVYKISALIKTS